MHYGFRKKNDLKVKVDIFDLKFFFTWAILLNQKFCEVSVKKEAIKKLKYNTIYSTFFGNLYFVLKHAFIDYLYTYLPFFTDQNTNRVAIDWHFQ